MDPWHRVAIPAAARQPQRHHPRLTELQSRRLFSVFRGNRKRQDRAGLWSAAEGGYRCQFVKAQDLFDEMYASLADRSSRQLLKRLTRLDVLLIDEFGYLNLKPEQSNIFFKLMEERYRQHSTIITTNLVYDEWPNFLGNRPMVEALLSRLRHYCHTVHIDGPSLRPPQG